MSTPNETPGNVAPVTVLVVDDDKMFLELMTELLGEAGFVPIAAGSAAETATLLAEHPEVALMMCDIDLRSNGNGVAIAQDARERRPDLPILFISGHSTQLADSIMADLNHVSFLQKPFRWEQLAATLDAILTSDQ